MTVGTVLRLADAGEAADLAAFLGRLLRHDKGAAVRLQAHGCALAVFGHPPFEVLAVRAARLAGRHGAGLDTTVSAGQLLEGLDDTAATMAVSPSVTGPPWTGMLPPRVGWRRTAALPLDAVRHEVARGIAEFRARSEELTPARRTRAEFDRIAADIWARPLAVPGGAELPLRAMHAAQALGFLRPARVPGGPVPAEPAAAPDEITVFSSGPWLRARTAQGSVAVRRTARPGLAVTPLAVTPSLS